MYCSAVNKDGSRRAGYVVSLVLLMLFAVLAWALFGPFGLVVVAVAFVLMATRAEGSRRDHG
jgi:hypothetical protein